MIHFFPPLLPPRIAEELTDGNVEVKVYFNNSPLVDMTFDFCGILNELFGLTCPLKAGIYDDLSTTQTIPGYLPSVRIP